VPHGPVYINFDAELQEAKISEQLPPIDVARYMPQISTAAPAELVRQAAAMLKDPLVYPLDEIFAAW